jgi:hypothetical protein
MAWNPAQPSGSTIRHEDEKIASASLMRNLQTAGRCITIRHAECEPAVLMAAATPIRRCLVRGSGDLYGIMIG